MSDVLIVDDGEPVLWAELASRLGAAAVVKQPLRTGDLYWLSHGEPVGGERKRADDLVRSLLDDRLLDEMQRMQGLSQRHLFVSGQLVPWGKGTAALYGTVSTAVKRRGAEVKYTSVHHTDLPLRRMESALRVLQQECGVTVWWARDDDHLADLVADVWRHRESDVQTRLWRPGVELMRRNPVAAGYLTVEHVGERTAVALAERFPAEWRLAAAKDADVLAVEGVGPVRLRALRARYGGPIVP